MKTIIKKILLVFTSIVLLPYIFVLLLNYNNGLLVSDLKRWAEVKSIIITGKIKMISVFVEFMTFYPEYRSQFYYRLGWYKKLLHPLFRPMTTLYIITKNIGPGLFIHHGFSTVIAAKSIGKNCWINQQVTIGFSNKIDSPVIGDNVEINAGAKVIGGIRIGNNSIIGANAVVVKNVPENCTVVGVPAYIVRKNGVKCKEEL